MLVRSLRVQERRGEAIEDAVIAHLAERRALLVLDHCEHLLDASRRLVASVVSSCERCGSCARGLVARPPQRLS